MRIVILDGHAANPGDLSWEALKDFGELTIYDRTDKEDTIERSKDADIVLTNKVVFGRIELEQLPQLKYIGVTATGYNVVDMEAAHERGIIVTNVPAYSTESVAQAVFAHLLNITNRVEHYADQVRGGKWSESPYFCYWDTLLTELSGKTFGIVGLGNIGMRVAAIANAFGMKVAAYTSKSQEALPPYITKLSLDELYAECDVLSLHCPLTDSTYQMINRESIGKMKSSAILINTGRGALISEENVAAALKNNRLRAYCTDVLCEEPAAVDNPLLKCENAFVTPHNIWATHESRSRLVNVVINNVRAFIEGHPQNVV